MITAAFQAINTGMWNDPRERQIKRDTEREKEREEGEGRRRRERVKSCNGNKMTYLHRSAYGLK